MDRQIRASDFVLVVCTETYRRRARGDDTGANGKGVGFETLLTYQDIHDCNSLNDKCFVVRVG